MILSFTDLVGYSKWNADLVGKIKDLIFFKMLS